MTARIEAIDGDLVMYATGVIVDRAGCVLHDRGKGSCTCEIVVALTYSDDELALALFRTVAQRRKSTAGVERGGEDG